MLKQCYHSYMVFQLQFQLKLFFISVVSYSYFANEIFQLLLQLF
jgi:hypothetical protein